MSNNTTVTIDVIIHATEDIAKFYDSFHRVLGIDRKELTVQNLTGHHENPITMLHTEFSKKDAQKIIAKIMEGTSTKDWDLLQEDIVSRISSSGLHLRFAKQEFVNGVLAMQEKDAIKVKVYTPVYNKKELIESYLALIGRSQLD